MICRLISISTPLSLLLSLSLKLRVCSNQISSLHIRWTKMTVSQAPWARKKLPRPSSLLKQSSEHRRSHGISELRSSSAETHDIQWSAQSRLQNSNLRIASCLCMRLSTSRKFVIQASTSFNFFIASLLYSLATSSLKISCLSTLLAVMTCSELQSRHVDQRERDLHHASPSWETWTRLDLSQADSLCTFSEFPLI